MGYCSLRVVSPPLVEPVGLAEAALHLRLDTPEPDLLGYVMAARAWAEQYLGRALITQTLRYTVSPSRPPMLQSGVVINPIIFVAPLSWWPVGGLPMTLPMAPVQSVLGLTQRAADGQQTTLQPGRDFDANPATDPATVTLRGVGQPSGSDLAITYVAGYGDAADAVPPAIRHAIKMLAAFLYENRGDDEAGPPPAAVRMLLNPERLVTFA